MTIEEKRALEVAQCAHSAVMDTAVLCKLAGLDGTAVTEELRNASHALQRLIAIIQGH